MADLVGTMTAKKSLSGNLNAVLGKDGISAYEVAVKNGFEGTEIEWLASLKGEPFEYEDFTKEQLDALKIKGDKGDSGVYLGSGDMPEDCNVQIDPNGEAYELPTWKTILDYTLPEEKAGANGVGELLLALSDPEAVANANKMRVHIAFPQTTALAASGAWLSVMLQDKTSATYNARLIAGYNTAVTSPTANTWLYSTAIVEISDFGLNCEKKTFPRSFTSVQQLPNQHFAASANSSANAKIITGGYASHSIGDYTPYIKATIGSATSFKTGTRVFVEVQ